MATLLSSCECTSAQTEIIKKTIFSYLFSELFSVLLPAMPVQDQQLLERLQLRIDDLKPRKG